MHTTTHACETMDWEKWGSQSPRGMIVAPRQNDGPAEMNLEWMLAAAVAVKRYGLVEKRKER